MEIKGYESLHWSGLYVLGTALGLPMVTGDIQDIANITLSGTEVSPFILFLYINTYTVCMYV